MKCLFVSAGMLYGGAERVTSVLVNEWAKNDCETRILVTRTEKISKYSLAQNVEVVSCYEDIKKAKVGQLAIIRIIREICKEWKPDVVISFYNDLCALASIAILGLHIPLIYSERNDPNRTNQRPIDRVYRKIVENRANKIVFQTKGAQACYPPKVQKKSVVILNPLDTTSFPTHDFSNEKKEIVSVGRLEPQKNQRLLIESFSMLAEELSDYNLVIYGEGSLRKELETYIESKGLTNRVFLPGAKSGIQNYIKDASLFVLSSDYEGIPNALIEAMAIGLPCVSTDCSPGGARELICSGVNGVIVPCKNVVDLRSMIKKILNNKYKAMELGNNAIQIRDKVQSRIIAQQWSEEIKALIKKSV
jgi:GalNAc-alpha-(1->4)-GalNAc-alpha-(1->3)-diNAcBac-PP-undecaprenol alpha-1,4-N-acetyl-D-galactosaminyltransferase